MALRKLLLASNYRKLLFFLLTDILIIVSSLYLSFFIRFEFKLAAEYHGLILDTLPLFVSLKLLSLFWFNIYNITWKYVGLNDFYNIVKASIFSEAVLMVLILNILTYPVSYLAFLHVFDVGMPRSVFIIDGVLSFLMISGVRASKRFFLEIIKRQQFRRSGKKTIIVGAGNTCDMLLRDMAKQDNSPFYPVVLLDDNPQKAGTFVHGIKVLGATDRLSDVVSEYGIEAVIIAIPTLNYSTLRRLYNAGRDAGVSTIKIIPRIYDFHKPEINLKNLEEISIEDLIGRQTVTVDFEGIESFLKGKVTLITGAGGSIGSEIVMQVCGFDPAKVVLFDFDETALHNMRQKVQRRYPLLAENAFCAVGDVRDTARVHEVFSTYSPDIVFHAAAYKHVPMMEFNPKEAVKSNIFGTYCVAKASVEKGVQKFVMISTDKAVMPTSIMGATKRMAENVCRAFNGSGRTEFIAVRFGNVLGSRGSVLPLFLEQLKHGGPLTVTHKDMKRYFMTIPEAVSLVLQASVIGKGGDVLVLDMGVPITIVKLAEELIRMHGLEPYKDIDIQFTGMRPGEKLFEELMTAEEGTIATMSDKVFIARSSVRFTLDEIDSMLAEFHRAVENGGDVRLPDVKTLLRRYIKHYHEDTAR